MQVSQLRDAGVVGLLERRGSKLATEVGFSTSPPWRFPWAGLVRVAAERKLQESEDRQTKQKSVLVVCV